MCEKNKITQIQVEITSNISANNPFTIRTAPLQEYAFPSSSKVILKSASFSVAIIQTTAGTAFNWQNLKYYLRFKLKNSGSNNIPLGKMSPITIPITQLTSDGTFGVILDNYNPKICFDSDSLICDSISDLGVGYQISNTAIGTIVLTGVLTLEYLEVI